MNKDYSDVTTKVCELLLEAIWEREPEQVQSVESLDRRIAKLLRVIGWQLVSMLLSRFCSQVITAVARSENLTVHRQKRIKYFTLFGPVEIESPYLWNRQTKKGARPVKDKLLITHGGRSVGLEKALVDFGVEQSYQRAAKRFEEHYGWNIDRYRVRRAVVKMASDAVDYVSQRLDSVTEQLDLPEDVRPGVDKILVELDGCHIRTGFLEDCDASAPPKLTQKRQLPKKRRHTEWREVRVGFARPLAQKEERTFVARMSKYPEIVNLLFRAAIDQGMSRTSQIIAVGDGGNGLRSELQAQFPGLQFILDRPHLKKHLYEGAEAMGLRGNRKHNWVEEKLKIIDAGEVQSLLTELKAYRKRGQARLSSLCSYLQRFADCVDYNRFVRLGFPIGSGEIESAHRYIPQERLKIPGATWHPDSINPILALRLVRANDWWSEFWDKKASA